METKKIQNFTDLIAWQEAHGLVLIIYTETSLFPDTEKFSLVSQMRRSAISITSNIAEGFGRSGAREKAQFYAIAKGSLLELQSQLYIARDLAYMTGEKCKDLEDKIFLLTKLIAGLVRSAMRR
ncbi:MAG: four helix bundle protein [Patescibacteria group bacterium]